MALDFHPISIEKHGQYLEFFSGCETKTSDSSFFNLWAWAYEYGLEWAWEDDLVWIRQTIPETLYWAPAGRWGLVNWEKKFKDHFPETTVFIRIPEALLEIWSPFISVRGKWEESRDHWDYLYVLEELVGLKGKRFHKKKNLLNQFKKLYQYQYSPFNSTMTGLALGMQEDWCTWKDCESSEGLAAENRVISRVLKVWDNLPGLLGGALLVDDQMVAYTIAEKLAEDTILIHFEKGNQEFQGVNQAINQMFLENLNTNAIFVNREQDIGDEGLRRAKMSYNPVGFIKKYNVYMK